MEELVTLIKHFPLRDFRKGETLPTERDGRPIVYGIQRGFVKVYSVNANGEEQFIWLAGRLDIVPSEMLFSSRGNTEFLYTALCDMRAYAIDKREFLNAASGNIEIMTEIARTMSQHYDDLMMRIRSTEQSSAREKLIHTLYYMATRFSAEPRVALHELGLSLTHQEISQLVGTTRETTAIELKKLKDEGLIDYTRSQFFINVPKLESLL